MDPKNIDLKSAFSSPEADSEPSTAPTDADTADIDPAAAQEMAQEMTEARERLMEVPVADVVVNHAIGLYELAAIHLTTPEPDFDETRFAIDALKVLVEGLQGRLGEGEQMLTEALSSLQMGFVQRLAESEAS